MKELGRILPRDSPNGPETSGAGWLFQHCTPGACVKIDLWYDEEWPVLHIAEHTGTYDVPDHVVRDFLNARTEAARAQKRLLQHLQETNQPKIQGGSPT